MSRTFLSSLRRDCDVYPDSRVQHTCSHLATCKFHWSHSRGSMLPRTGPDRQDPYRRRVRLPCPRPSRRSKCRRLRMRTDRRPAAAAGAADRKTALRRASSSSTATRDVSTATRRWLKSWDESFATVEVAKYHGVCGSNMCRPVAWW